MAAALPMQIAAVWLYFALGRAWSKDLDRDDRLPFLAARVLHPHEIRRLRSGLRARGPLVIVLTRFAMFPAGLAATAAGSAGLPTTKYLVADSAGATVATLAAIGAGYGLGIAHEAAGPWLVGIGFVGLVAISALITVFIRRGDGDRRSDD